VTLAERLIGRGFELSIFDSFVKVSRLLGKNKEFIDREVPHLERLLALTPEDALADAQVIVVGHADPTTRSTIVSPIEGPPDCGFVRLRRPSHWRLQPSTKASAGDESCEVQIRCVSLQPVLKHHQDPDHLAVVARMGRQVHRKQCLDEIAS
jgi:hypothetical protein